VLLVLGAVAIVAQGPCGAYRSREQAALLPGFVPADVAAVRIARPGAEVTLRREGGAWLLGAGKEAADAGAVEALLKSLADARVAAVVSTNVAKQEAYETDGRRGVALRVDGPGGASIAAFVIGKRGPDFASCYLRREGKSDVLLVTPDLRLEVSRPAEAWRAPVEKPASPAPAPAGAK
jgi:hypothetical protein